MYKRIMFSQRSTGIILVLQSNESSHEQHHQTLKYVIKCCEKYPFKSNAVFNLPHLRSDIRRFQLLNYDTFNYQLPHYFYYITSLSETELEDKYDNMNLLQHFEKKGLSLLMEKYSFTVKKHYQLFLEIIEIFLDGLAKINASTFFNTELKVKEYTLNLPDCFINVNSVFQYFKNHKADDMQSIIIFIYSFSVLIDNFCYCISNLTRMKVTTTEEENIYSLSNEHIIINYLPEDSLAKCAETIKAFLDSYQLNELIEEYRDYYNEYKDLLNELSNIIENTNHRSVLAFIDAPCCGKNKGFYPFEYLRKSLESLYKLLITKKHE